MKQKRKKKNRRNEKNAAEKVYKKRQAAYERICIILFLSVIFFTGLCLMFLTRPKVSEIENRELAKKPEFTLESYFSGEYTDKFSVYFSDTVPFRENLVELSSAFNKAKGISAPTFYGNVNVVADDDGNSVEAADTVTEQTDVVSVTEPPVTDENGQTEMTSEPAETTVPTEAETTVTTTEEEEVQNIADFSNNGIVVDGVKMYGDNAGVMLFGGSKSTGTRYAELISRYKTELGEDINVYNMVVPTSVEFYLPKKFNKYSSSEKDSISHIYSSYTADVIPVDAYTEIAAHTDEYIYLRTDHHWSHRGAYYAYYAFAKALGQTPPTLEEGYEEKTKDGFVGSLYNYTNDPILKNSPEIFTYYKPKSEYQAYYYDYVTLSPKGAGPLFYENVSGGGCYGMFIGADAIHTRIETKLDTGRKLCVFKESYGNALVPYLVDSFDEIYVVDIRYFGRNALDYIRENGITDVLFINNAFAANTNSLIDGMEKLLTEPYGTLDEEKIAEAQAYYATMPTEATDAAETSVTQPATDIPAETAAPVSRDNTATETAADIWEAQ